MSVSLETKKKVYARRALERFVIIEERFALFDTTESFLSTGDNMAYDNLKKKIRELAHSLAYEEEIQHKFKGWYSRKKEHDFLLNKLYRLEKVA